MNHDKIIAYKIEYANTTIKTIIGLMFRRDIPQDFAMVFDMGYEQPIWLHTLFCSKCIDAVFLDRDKMVIQIMRCLHPWQINVKPSRPARYFIETLAGEVSRHDIHHGDTVKV